MSQSIICWQENKLLSSIRKSARESCAFPYYIISKCARVSLIAKTIFSVECDLERFNPSTALRASYIGNPRLHLTSAIYAVCTLKP